MSKARDVADQVKRAGSPADVEQITQGLSPAEREAVLAELEK